MPKPTFCIFKYISEIENIVFSHFLSFYAPESNICIQECIERFEMALRHTDDSCLQSEMLPSPR